MYNETLPLGYELKNWDESYIIEDVKGQGGFGITYSARRVSDGLHVAVKEYYPRQLSMQRAQDGSVTSTHPNQKLYEGGMKSFLDEATALSKLKDIPSVVKALSYFQANKTAYLVMEYIEGISLKNYVLHKELFKAYDLLPVYKTLLEDIDRMHRTGLLHRDIAPDNIMLTNEGTLRLIDFGSARSVENGKSMTVVLKPGFAPIEQYMTHGQGTYTDVYGACATLYYCLTGKVPVEAMKRLDEDPMVPANQYGAGLTQRQEEVLMRGLALQPPTAKSPGKKPRYRTMGEFIKAFPWDETQKPYNWTWPAWLPQPEPPEPVEEIDIDEERKKKEQEQNQTIVLDDDDGPKPPVPPPPPPPPTDSTRKTAMIIIAIVCGIMFIFGFSAMCNGSGFGMIFALIGIVGLIIVAVSAYNHSQWKG